MTLRPLRASVSASLSFEPLERALFALIASRLRIEDQLTTYTAEMADGELSVRVLVVQNDLDKPLGRIADALVGESAPLDVRMSTDDLPHLARYDDLVVLAGLSPASFPGSRACPSRLLAH